jgi:glycosyltransferase involved in cell wall biosynthesis
MINTLSIIIPAKNEHEGLKKVLPSLCSMYGDVEIIIVDDGSTDDTRELCQSYPVKVISHKYSMGNGAAIKTGVRNSKGEILVFMDADGQHRPDEIGKLIDKMSEGYDMVVGARKMNHHASTARFIANSLYSRFASRVTGHKVDDLTSGLRAIRSDKIKQFLYMLPNGFSYPTTITMAMFRAGYSVCYVPVDVLERTGNSHIRPLVDGVRFLLIIFRIGTLYSPLKFFVPASVIIFATGLGYYCYTYFTAGRFTNMGILLFIMSALIFLIGLLSEQLTVLLYSHSQDKRPES